MAAYSPLPNKMRFDGTKKKTLLALIREDGYHPGAQARQLGTSGRTLRRHVSTDPDFAEAIEDARGEFLQNVILRAARERAIDGVEEVTSGPGGTKITRRKYSDALLLALMKSKHGLGQFTDKVEVDQHVTGAIEHSGAIHPSDLTLEQQRAARVLLRRN